MQRALKIGAWALLYAAFVLAAVALKASLADSESAEIFGWDYGLYLRRIKDWSWITYTGFRHPGLGIVMSPLVVLEHLWAEAYLLVMPMVALATSYFVLQLGGFWALVAYLAFPSTWVLAGTPESFPIAQLCLAASVACTASADLRRTLAFSMLNGAVTLTNGVKGILSFIVISSRRRDIRNLALIFGGLAVAGAVFFFVRAEVTGRSCDEGVVKTLSWIPTTRHFCRELYGFFIRPLGFAAASVYPLAACGVVRILRGGIVAERNMLKTLAAYFAIDAFLHLVIGWGMDEPWVFAPHYLWMIAVLAGRGARK